MSERKITVGLMVQRITRYKSEHVDVTAMSREDDASYPRGTTWYLSDGKPCIDGLSMRGCVWAPDYDHDRPPVFDVERPAFYDCHCVEFGKAKAMATTLGNIAKRVERDNAREPGDMLLAMARAIGAQWICIPHRGRYQGGSWSDSRWIWYGLTDGRNAYRSLIEEALREERERQAERNKPVEPVAQDLAWHPPQAAE